MFVNMYIDDFVGDYRHHPQRGEGRGHGKHGRHRGRGGSTEDHGHHMGRGPFGRGGGGGGGRIFGPGGLRLVLLGLIEETPRHGYQLIKELEQKFGGAYAPSPGSVYPMLTLLEELGHVRSATSEGTKRLFEITAEGAGYLRENDAALKSAMSRMDMAARAVAGEAPPPDLHHAMHTLRAAVQFHRGGWDEKETQRVSQIIETAAASIARRPE
jgi:DNA-binding PadR family transcriptional regulator